VGDPRRQVPRTDALLAEPALAEPSERLGPGLVKQIVSQVQQLIREGQLPPQDALAAILERLPRLSTTSRPVLNATGVVLHTNLGRASLSAAALAAVQAAGGYVDVEFDLATGQRARRGRGALAALTAAVPEAEDVLVLNNGAAALLLATTTYAAGREVILSRGELVEIGDGFRLPALIESAGARIREVGTTNRTNLADYTAAIGVNTGCVLKVHPSNFEISGFTSSVEVRELATLGSTVIVDVGSGLLAPNPLLPDEPDVTSALRAGADLVTCSGDKLLGGPQAGLVFGRAEAVQALRESPLARALRVDKLTLAALEATLRGPRTPTARYLHADAAGLKQRCERILTEAELPEAELVPSNGAVGGGGAPGLQLPGWAVALPTRYAEELRAGTPAVIGRIEHGRCLLDLRCIEPADDAAVLAALREVSRSR
jgi:L-seryl-tRNA(Ser) seleniumtransferase